MAIKQKVDRAKTDYDEVYAAGRKAEYDAFWDLYQENGKRYHYMGGFSGKGWNDKTFYPKYDIKPSYAVINCFLYCGVTDLEARLQECGVVLDISDNINYSTVFENTTLTVIPELLINKGANTVTGMFRGCKSLHTIRKIKLQEGFNIHMPDAFTNCTALENIVFEGVIPKNITFQWSTLLSKASIISIINALSTTATGQTATFSQTAVNNAFSTEEWDALIATRSNWTIALA